MKRTFSVTLSIVLLFAFVFSMVATIHTSVQADPAEYACCWWAHADNCSWHKGVWIDGACRCYAGMLNPHDCDYNCSTPVCW